MKTFKDNKDLIKVLMTEKNGIEFSETYKGQQFDDRKQCVVDGCPDCLTDVYLMDI